MNKALFFTGLGIEIIQMAALTFIALVDYVDWSFFTLSFFKMAVVVTIITVINLAAIFSMIVGAIQK